MNAKRIMSNLGIAWRAIKRAVGGVFDVPNSTWTADHGDVFTYSEGDSTHPSLLCKCPDGENLGPLDHLPDCEWAKQMCKECGGTGWCPGCGGDGCGHASEGTPWTCSCGKLCDTIDDLNTHVIATGCRLMDQ